MRFPRDGFGVGLDLAEQPRSLVHDEVQQLVQVALLLLRLKDVVL